MGYSNITKRIRDLIYEYEAFKKNRNPNNQTLNQRLIFWNVGKEIFFLKPFFGHGTGGSKIAYKQYYLKTQTLLNKDNQLLAHNQFITQLVNLGLIGFVLWLGILLYSFIKSSKSILFLSIPYLILMFLAFMSDDMLEIQAGVTIFSFFGTLILFQVKEFN